MADTSAPANETAARAWRLPLVMGLALALLGGAGGFFAVQSGILPLADRDAGSRVGEAGTDLPKAAASDITFVPIEPILISLQEPNRHLRFRAQLEVGRNHQREVEQLMPRIVDVLNSYLRALEPADLADGRSLSRLRAQMLRRVQIVTGSGRVHDLLIMEFVLN